MEEDNEFKAIQEISASLQGLDEDARNRVLTYVFSRLGITLDGTNKNGLLSMPALSSQVVNVAPQTIANDHDVDIRSLQDIRSLKEIKKPSTAVEMAVLVAYYLGEMVPDSQKKLEIGTPDITTYFKQAGYPLPSAPKMTLVHGKNAGYFESVDRGLFKLNPVGYNLAAHTMGQDGRASQTPRKSRTKKVVAKKTSKKTKSGK